MIENARQIARASSEELQRIRFVVDLTDHMVVVTDAQRRVLWVNSAFTRVTGWTREEVLGRAVSSVLHGPDTDPDTKARIAAVLNNGEAVSNVELLDYAKDGRRYWASLNIRPVRDVTGDVVQFVAIAADVTERHLAEQRVRDSERRLAESQRLAQIGSWEFDLAKRELFWSDETFRIFEVSPVGFKPTYETFLERVHPDDRTRVDDAYTTSVRERISYEVRHRLLFPNDRIKWVVERGRTDYAGDGTPARSIGTVQDITARRRAEEMLLEKERAEAANAAKSRFLSHISHELRTPLNAIVGFAQIMETDLQSPLPDVHRKRLRYMREAGEHLVALVTDLLDLSSIEAGAVSMALETADVEQAVGEAVGIVQPMAQAHSIAIEISTEGPGPTFVLCDRKRLRQVLVNLLSNAIKYNRPQGRVTVRIGTAADVTVEVCVDDTGPGIDPTQLECLFQPFERLGAAGGAVEGTGLGLAITKELVERMQGEIRVASTVGVGSSFCISLKRAAQEDSGS